MRVHGKTKNVQQTLDRLTEQLKTSYAPPKFCVDCEWHGFDRVLRKDDYVYKHYCNCPPLLDVITGKPSSAAVMRNTATKCGQDAKFFSGKVKKEK